MPVPVWNKAAEGIRISHHLSSLVTTGSHCGTGFQPQSPASWYGCKLSDCIFVYFCIGWQGRRREKSHWKRLKSTSKQTIYLSFPDEKCADGMVDTLRMRFLWCTAILVSPCDLLPMPAFLQATFHQMLWQWRRHHWRSKWPFEAPHHSLLAPHGWVGELTRLAPACGRFPAFLAQRKVQRSGKPPAEAALGIIKAPLRSAYPQKFQMLHAE